MPAEIPADTVHAVREVLVAVKAEAGLRAAWITDSMLDRAARPIARLLVQLVDAAVERRRAVGACGQLTPTYADVPRVVCVLLAGHDGWHDDGDGCTWGSAA